MRLGSLPDGKILVALSGGGDSTALLLCLCEKIGKERVCAFHLNHCLRGEESDRDEEFCRSLCGKLGVEFQSARREIAVERRRGETVEQAARRVRYDELSAAARRMGCAAVATAHNADDQAETMLLNLARGSGGNGFSGIPPVRELDGLTLLRPLLDVTRREIDEFLAQRGQEFVEDSSNRSEDYSRNVLRHHAIPALKRVNSRAVEHFAAAARLAREDEEFMHGQGVWLVECARTGVPGRFSAELLADAARPIARRALRIICQEAGCQSPERVHIAALERLCAGDDPSARTSLPGGLTARREYGELMVEMPETGDEFEEIPLKIGANEFGKYIVFAERAVAPDVMRSEGFDLERPLYLRGDREYILRARREGDYIRPKGRGLRKTVKKLCIDLKIPANDRGYLPILFPTGGADGQEAAAFPGSCVGDGYGGTAGREAVKVWVVKKA